MIIDATLSTREAAILRAAAHIPSGTEIPSALRAIALVAKDALTGDALELSRVSITAVVLHWRLACFSVVAKKDGTVEVTPR